MTSFFRNFWKVRNFQISEISEISKHSEKPVSKITKNFPKFPNFSELFTEHFQTFWPKNRVFCPKTSNFTSFFQNFQNLQNFRIITEFFLNLNFQTFFRTFSRKFRQFENSASSKIPVFSEKFPNFENRTFPKLAKTKSSEISV